MKGIHIKEKIDENNRIIESLLSPNQFTLNNTVRDLIKEIDDLQNQCEHEFEEGCCIYCYKGEN